MTSRPMIAIQNLKKSFRDKKFRTVHALKGVSLEVIAGESFGFVGPNGAGKSTTIKILLGVLTASEGKAEINGVDVGQHQARQSVGYVPENPYLYDYLTPLEMLKFGARMHGIKMADLHAHCMQWLERFGIGHVAKKRIRTFSKGMTQRVALAHALVTQPKLLILDEPLSGLDPIGRREVVDVLMEYRQQGGTIFFSSHILTDVERLGERFGVIHKGKLRTISTPSELVGHVDRMQIVTRGEHAPHPTAREEGKLWRTACDEKELWNVLEQIRNAGHSIVEVRPEGLGLEAAFMQFIQKVDTTADEAE